MSHRLSPALLPLLVLSIPAACTIDDAPESFNAGHIEQAGTSAARSVCLLPACDWDGDGFAYEDCYEHNCTKDETEVKPKMESAVVNGEMIWCDPDLATFSASENCPPDTIQRRQTEALECDHVFVDNDTWPKSIGNLDEIKSHVRQQRIDQDNLLYVQPYGRNYEFAAGWQALLGDIHPGQGEISGNQIDDDCDGLVDETEYVYSQYGRGVREGGFTMWVSINDSFIKEHADRIVARIYPLENVIDNDDHLDALKFGEGDGYQPQLPNSADTRWIDEVEFDYSGSGIVSLDFDDLPNRGAVYAVELTYHKRITPTIYFQLGYVDANGEPDFSLSPVHDSSGNRVTSEVYLTATQAYGRAGAWDYSVMRRKITNSAIMERDLSDRGEVGWQANYGFAGTSGEEYSGTYDEWWCGDFLVHIYAEVAPAMGGANTDDLFDTWMNNWDYSFIGYTADKVRQQVPRFAEHGDYLLVTSDPKSTRGHATMFIAFSPSPSNPATGMVWRIGGNESNRVKLQALPVDSDYRGIGYLPRPDQL